MDASVVNTRKIKVRAPALQAWVRGTRLNFLDVYVLQEKYTFCQNARTAAGHGPQAGKNTTD